MDIRTYRKSRGLTQPQLAQELKVICEGTDAPLISKMEKGLCLPPEEIQLYLEAQEENEKQVKQDLSPAQTLIYDRLLSCRGSRPVGRQELSLLTGMPDRAVRRELETMRRMGLRICSMTEGYWLTSSETEYKVYRARELKRAKSILATVSAMDKHIEGQVGLNG